MRNPRHIVFRRYRAFRGLAQARTSMSRATGHPNKVGSVPKLLVYHNRMIGSNAAVIALVVVLLETSRRDVAV